MYIHIHTYIYIYIYIYICHPLLRRRSARQLAASRAVKVSGHRRPKTGPWVNVNVNVNVRVHVNVNVNVNVNVVEHLQGSWSCVCVCSLCPCSVVSYDSVRLAPSRPLAEA